MFLNSHGHHLLCKCMTVFCVCVFRASRALVHISSRRQKSSQSIRKRSELLVMPMWQKPTSAVSALPKNPFLLSRYTHTHRVLNSCFINCSWHKLLSKKTLAHIVLLCVMMDLFVGCDSQSAALHWGIQRTWQHGSGTHFFLPYCRFITQVSLTFGSKINKQAKTNQSNS